MSDLFRAYDAIRGQTIEEQTPMYGNLYASLDPDDMQPPKPRDPNAPDQLGNMVSELFKTIAESGAKMGRALTIIDAIAADEDLPADYRLKKIKTLAAEALKKAETTLP